MNTNSMIVVGPGQPNSTSKLSGQESCGFEVGECRHSGTLERMLHVVCDRKLVWCKVKRELVRDDRMALKWSQELCNWGKLCIGHDVRFQNIRVASRTGPYCEVFQILGVVNFRRVEFDKICGLGRLLGCGFSMNCCDGPSCVGFLQV